MPLLALGVILMAAGCTTIRATAPTWSAQEVFLITTVADRAAEALAEEIPTNLATFVDPSGFSAEDRAYGLAAIEDALLRHGVRLVGDRAYADAIIVPRAGVLSTDEKQTLLGIPPLPGPTPIGDGVVTVPSLSLYQHNEINGIAKFAASVYDPRTGKLIASTDPACGFSHSNDGVVLFFFTWRKNDTDIDLGKHQPKSVNGEQKPHSKPCTSDSFCNGAILDTFFSRNPVGDRDIKHALAAVLLAAVMASPAMAQTWNGGSLASWPSHREADMSHRGAQDWTVMPECAITAVPMARRCAAAMRTCAPIISSRTSG